MCFYTVHVVKAGRAPERIERMPVTVVGIVSAQ
jgi:hypothetical protein